MNELPVSTTGLQVGRHARAGVELTNCIVPCRHERTNRLPERWRAPGVEVSERDALLLDPRVVTEVEDTPAIEVFAIDHVVGIDRPEMLVEDAGGGGFVERTAEVAERGARPFAVVQRRAIGGHGHDDIVTTETAQLRDLDRGHRVAYGRQTKMHELIDQTGGETEARGQPGPTGPSLGESGQVIGRTIAGPHAHIAIPGVADPGRVL